jgi:hypothetical protein
MSQRTDWLPTTRDGILAIADDWLSVCIGKKTAWNIPDSAMTDCITFKEAAANTLETAKNETTRTPVATAQCKEAFDALTAFIAGFQAAVFFIASLARFRLHLPEPQAP